MNSGNLTAAQIEDYAVHEFVWLESDYGFTKAEEDNRLAAHFTKTVSYQKGDLIICLTIDILSLSTVLLQFDNIANSKSPADRPYLGSVIERLDLPVDYPPVSYKSAKLRNKKTKRAIQRGKITQGEAMVQQIQRESTALKDLLAVREIAEVLAVL
jgi:hypothetical protein